MKYQFFIFFIFFISSCQKDQEPDYISDWTSNPTIKRNWAGENFWLNPLQAWRQIDGKLRCEVSGGDRNVIALTREMNDSEGSFELSVSFEKIKSNKEEKKLHKNLNPNGWIGFQLGLQGQFNDYRDDAIKGRGLSLGLTQNGNLFIGDMSLNPVPSNSNKIITAGQITVSGKKYIEGNYIILLNYLDINGEVIQSLERSIHPSWLVGLIGLTCSQSHPATAKYHEPKPIYTKLKDLKKSVGGDTNFAFSKWEISGEKITTFSDRSYGPILWTQHTLSNDVMKMSVQMVPIGNDNREVILSIDGVETQRGEIDKDGRNVLFKITNWDSTIDHSYEVSYVLKNKKQYTYKGTIRKNPISNNLKIASLSCVDDRGFPHQDLVDNVGAHNPEMLMFHGDQLYERVAGYGVERNSILDYQRKWYVFGWSFRDLMKDIPSIIIPDDHDVFHGNLWGNGGKAADVSKGYGYDSQDSGGYKEKPEFVNMVHRTQTGHLPDAYDPTPVLQGISVYYTNMNYGGVSFAILGDRQWKSAPKQYLPNAEIENGWPQNKMWNPKTEAYHKDAQLLGLRQEDFLEKWVEDWNENIYFKTLVSQSPFCNIATLPADIWHDKYVPGLPRYKKGEYPKDDRPVADFDSNAWPQNKRNKAIGIIRKAFALHITGDQHLGSTGQYGVDEYGDSGYWLATPAVANLWPRRWFPAKAAKSGKAADDTRKYTGDYEDGFGNKIRVKAVANPYDIDREPEMVFDKAPGYSIINFSKKERKIEVAVWPRWASPKQVSPDNQPYEGWPITINQQENFGKKDSGYLPSATLDGETLIKIFREDNQELVYVIKPTVGEFVAKVFDKNITYRMEKVSKGKKEKSEGLQAN